MENTKPSGFSEIKEFYKDLSPLDQSREIFLVATLFREELGLGSSWSYEVEQSQREYARSIGNHINASVESSATPEEIEDTIVRNIIGETQRRWHAYTERIDSNNKVDEFIDLLPGETSITCSLEDKTVQVRNSWRKFLEDYGMSGAEYSPVVRAEFVGNKTIWDTTKESRFLQTVMQHELQDQAVAA